jgi:thiamine biosynthesis lipoprotein
MASPHTPALEGLNLEARHAFRCFNTDVAIELSDWRWSYLLAPVETFFQRFEARFSRFLADSELTRFNRREKPAFTVSDEMHDLLSESLRLHELTGGVFNPLVLQSLETAGYDVSFEKVGEVKNAPAPSGPLPELTCLELDGHRASLPLGLRLDFGGIGKGYSVDLASALLAEASGYLIDAGGDIYASGLAPDGGPWYVDVADPAAPESRVDVVALSNQAIATSWTTRRRWKTAGGWAHHLIDPRTGLPAESGVSGSTVITSRAVEADVFAKCALILGPEEGLAFLEARGAHGLLVLADGSIRTTSDWPSA